MNRNTIFLLSTISLAGLLLSGCGIENIFKPREIRTAWLPVRGLPAKQSILLQVKNLSRDLEWCLEKTDLPSFSDKNLLKLVNQDSEFLGLTTETHSTSSCKKTLSYLNEKINSALESGNSKQKVYEALLEGKAEVTSEN